MTYPFQLPKLPYPYNSLTPTIDTETMHYHHDKHFKTYVDNLNKLLEPYVYLQNISLEYLLLNERVLPFKDKTAILNNAGGVYNHLLFFKLLQPANKKTKDLILQKYTSMDYFKDLMIQEGMSIFGSGYVSLVLFPNGSLNIIKLSNQDTSLKYNAKTLLLIDVWEHSYYLKYKNNRKSYLKNVLDLLLD